MLLFAFCLLPSALHAQATENPAATSEQQLENNAEQNNDIATEDDDLQLQLQWYIKHPVNLNTAGEEELNALQLLSPIQIQNCIRYRNMLGKFIDIYELQAIPTWTVLLIQKIKQYVIVGNSEVLITTLKNRLKAGGQSFLARVSQTLERSKGYLQDSANNFYPGSPQKILVRYQYQFKNLLQYGFVAEKDAGEQFFRGVQKQGFDFYSFHFFAGRIGIIKSLVAGDFTVNLGQGLTEWQSLAFKKSADVLNIKRESAVLRPYHSAGEINFHRGAGMTIAKKNLEATFFISYRKIDANLVRDTASATEDFVSALQISGYHRTKSEAADKAIQGQWVAGGNISYRYKNLHFGTNTVLYQFKLPLKKSNEPYNLYALQGRSFGNYSIDYSYTYKNLHWFGEAAANYRFYKAYINGLLISVAPAADAVLVFRSISAGYQSLYGNAFTDNTNPTNEKGIYIGLSVHPDDKFRVDAYADLYSFPWLKYMVDAPSSGTDYLLQLSYKHGKNFEIYSRFRAESSTNNINPGLLALSPLLAQARQSWRTQYSYKISQQITIKSRTEMIWFNGKIAQQEHGFLTYTDISCSPIKQPFSINMRLQYFETDSYNSRLYAYENDVLFSYSIPVFYDKGIRYYINGNYHINKHFTIWARFAQTLYYGKTAIGTGLDEIEGRKRTEIKLQMMYKF